MSETQTTLRDQLSEAFANVEKQDENQAVTTTTAAETQTPEKTESTAAERARDEAGRFAKEEKERKEKAAAVASATAPARPPRPSSWKKDYEKDWETLDPRLAAYIDQREKEYAKGVSTYKQEWDRARPVLEAIAPFQEQFQRYGVAPEQWVRTLGAAHQALALGTPQQKLAMFAKLAQDYGVPLAALLPRPQQQPDGQPAQQPVVDPRLALWLQQQLGGVKSELQQWKTAQAEAQAAQVAKEIEVFGQSNEHPHFEALKETMAQLLESGIATDLQGAYDTALRMPQHDEIWTAIQEQKRQASEARRAEEAAKAAASAKKKAVSLKSSSPGAAAASEGKKGLRDAYAEAVTGMSSRV